jgi:hypothetical protein
VTPTARSLAWLKQEGWTYASVERRIPGKFVTIDAFGFLDYIALKTGQNGVLGLQFTSGSNHASRVEKILLEPRARLWLDCSNRIWVMSWSKAGPRGSRKLWKPRIQEIRLEDFYRMPVPVACHVGSC